MADIKLDNLAGDLTLLNSAADGLSLTIGEKFMPEVRGLVQAGTGVISFVNDLIDDHPGSSCCCLQKMSAIAWRHRKEAVFSCLSPALPGKALPKVAPVLGGGYPELLLEYSGKIARVAVAHHIAHLIYLIFRGQKQSRRFIHPGLCQIVHDGLPGALLE